MNIYGRIKDHMRFLRLLEIRHPRFRTQMYNHISSFSKQVGNKLYKELLIFKQYLLTIYWMICRLIFGCHNEEKINVNSNLERLTSISYKKTSV